MKEIIKAVKSKGYSVFEQDDKPFNLNIIGVRSNDLTPDVFNDRLHILWKYRGKWNELTHPVTCDSGLYWLNNPMSKLGTAIVKEGQYKGVWKTGLHKGRYFALTQKNPITVIRDYNKDNKIDLSLGVEESGMFGINYHRCGETEAFKVGKWSAGCIVNPNPQVFEVEMEIFREAAKIWGDSFTFTLLNENDL